MERVQRESGLSEVGSVLILSGSFLLGGCLGALFSARIDAERFLELQQYLFRYMELVAGGEVTWSFRSVLWSQGRWFLLCGILGMTWLGALLLPCCFGVRGFLLAFGAGCFLRAFDGKGLFPAMLLFGGPALLWAPVFFLTGLLCVKNCLRLLRRAVGQSVPVSFGKGAIRRCVWLNLGMLALCGGFECMLLPILLRLAGQMMG